MAGPASKPPLPADGRPLSGPGPAEDLRGRAVPLKDVGEFTASKQPPDQWAGFLLPVERRLHARCQLHGKPLRLPRPGLWGTSTSVCGLVRRHRFLQGGRQASMWEDRGRTERA